MTDQRMVGERRLEVTQGDITREAVDAIANAANAALCGGGGVDGAIHAAAGPELMVELRRDHPHGTPVGTAVATGGFALPARWVFHAVGPIWGGGGHGERELLEGAYRSCLGLADRLGARSVAFPAISMGIYRYPAPEGAEVALATVAQHLSGPTSIEVARFVLFSSGKFGVFREALARLT